VRFGTRETGITNKIRSLIATSAVNTFLDDNPPCRELSRHGQMFRASSERGRKTVAAAAGGEMVTRCCGGMGVDALSGPRGLYMG
jgi:hypothetical protein